MQNPTPEEWKQIEGFEGRYEISNHGRVKSVARRYNCFGQNTCKVRERMMKFVIHNNGYYVVWLRKAGVHKKFFIHVLVARHFIPNPEGKPVVNHIDCNKLNCHIGNLEWMTFSENTCYYYANRVDDGVVF